MFPFQSTFLAKIVTFVADWDWRCGRKIGDLGPGNFDDKVAW